MKYAIMSDAHSNPTALEKALADAKRRKCGKFVYLGDVTGYGYDAKGALDLVRENFDVVLLGNHDAVCCGLDNDGFTRVNRHYDIDRAQGRKLADEDLAWLLKLKLGYRCREFIGVHGDFINPRSWGYILEPEDARLNFSACRDRVMFCGHSHHAAVWELTPKKEVIEKFEERFCRPAVEEESLSFKLAEANRYIVNVGSVGYPRHDYCSTYAIFDSETRRVTFRRLPFDFKGYINAMISAGIDLPRWLTALLVRAVNKE